MYDNIKKPKSLIFFDIETKYRKKDLSLRKMSVVEYVMKTEMIALIAHRYGLIDGKYVHTNSLELWGSECHSDKQALKQWFGKAKDRWYVAHNGFFDMLYMSMRLNLLGPDCTLIDTLAMAQYLWHDYPTKGVKPVGLGLDTLGKRLLGVPKFSFAVPEDFGWEEADKWRTNMEIENIKNDVLDYNEQDVELTAQLFFFLRRQNIPKQQYGAINWALQQFSNPSLFLDRESLPEYLHKLSQERIDTFSKLGVDPATLRSNEKCAKFFESRGFPVPSKAGKNGPIPALAKTDAFIYENENQQTPLGELVRARLLAKSSIESTRAASWLRTGSNHYHYHAMPSGTFTHRLAGRPGGGGNPLNLARNSPLRNFILPSRGQKLIVFDFSGLELHIARWGALDTKTMAQLEAGIDIYSKFMCDLLQKDYDDFKESHAAGDKHADALRFVGKQAQLSLQYSVGAEKFMQSIKQSGKYPMHFAEALEIVKYFRYTACQGVSHAWHMFSKYALKEDIEIWLQAFQEGVWQRGVNFPGEPTAERSWRWPSGRELRFPDLTYNPSDERYYYYPMEGLDHNIKRDIYGGAMFQSFCQSCANEVIDCVRGNLLDAGYNVVSECYDELTIAVDKTAVDTEETRELTFGHIRDIATNSHYAWWDKTQAPPLKIDIACGDNYGDAKP